MTSNPSDIAPQVEELISRPTYRELERLDRAIAQTKHKLMLLEARRYGHELVERWVPMDTEQPPKEDLNTGLFYGFSAWTAKCPFAGCEQEYTRDEVTDSVEACEHYDSEISNSVLFIGPKEDLIP